MPRWTDALPPTPSEPQFWLVSDDRQRGYWLSQLLGQHGLVVPMAVDMHDIQGRLAAGLPQAVLVDFGGAASPRAAQVAQRLRLDWPQLLVLGVGEAADTVAVLAALRAGVQDFVDSKAPQDELLRSLRQALVPPPAVPPSAGGRPLGKVLVLLGARGGLGVTTLAAHLAVMLQDMQTSRQRGGERAAGRASDSGEVAAVATRMLLLDLGLPLRDGQMVLNAPSGFSVLEGVDSMHRLDKTLLDSALAHHSSGTAVLSWPQEVQALRRLPSSAVLTLVQRLRAFFDWQVLDLGGFAPLDDLLPLLQGADRLWCVCDQSLGGIVSSVEQLRQLREAGLTASGQVVVNKFHAQVGLPAQDVARRLDWPLAYAIPERAAALLQACGHGQLLSQHARGDAYVAVIRQMARDLLSGHELPAAEPAGSREAAVGWASRVMQWAARRKVQA